MTDRLTAMTAPAVQGLQHGQPIPGYGECVSGNLKTGVMGNGWPRVVSHDGLLTPTGTPAKTIDKVSAGRMNDYW